MANSSRARSPRSSFRPPCSRSICRDADIAGGVSLVERLRIYVPEPDALRAAFDDAGADAVAWLGLEFTVEESRSWPGSHTRATVLRET